MLLALQMLSQHWPMLWTLITSSMDLHMIMNARVVCYRRHLRVRCSFLYFWTCGAL